MAEAKWLDVTGNATAYREWARSWRQEIECKFGTYPVLTAHIEKVRVYEDGRVEHFHMNPVVISMAQLTGQELLDAVSVQDKLTKLIGDALSAKLSQASNPEPGA